MIRALLITLAVLFSPVAVAQTPQAVKEAAVEDAAIEQRARDLGKTLRCVVCQNQSIEDSDAELTADMRALVRERLAAGDSEAEITAMMRDRYGDYVLLKPPFQANTVLLWIAPAGLMAGGLIWLLARRNHRHDAAVEPLTEAERKRLDAMRANR